MDKNITTHPRATYAYSSETDKYQNNHNRSKNPIRALGRRLKEAANQLTLKPEKKTSSSPPFEKQIHKRAVSDTNLYKINSQVNFPPSPLGATYMTHHVSTPHLHHINASETQASVLPSHISLSQWSYGAIPTHTSHGNLNTQALLPGKLYPRETLAHHHSDNNLRNRISHEESKSARPNLKWDKLLSRSHNQLSKNPVNIIDSAIDSFLALGFSLDDFERCVQLQKLDYRCSGEDKRAYADHSETITIERRCIETLDRITNILTSNKGKEIPIRNSAVNIEQIKHEIGITLQCSQGIAMSYLDTPWDSEIDASRLFPTVIVSINENPTSPNMTSIKLGITNTKDGYIFFRPDHLKETLDKNLTKNIAKKSDSLDQLLNGEFFELISSISKRKDVILSSLTLFSSYQYHMPGSKMATNSSHKSTPV